MAMALYFDILPVSIRQSILFYIPKAYLVCEKYPSRFFGHVFNIFDLNTFKPCDTEYFWRTLYSKFSSSETNDYKAAYINGSLIYLQNLINSMYTVIDMGHEKNLLAAIKDVPDCWLDYENLFIYAANRCELECMKIIDDSVELDLDTYQAALNDIYRYYGYDYNASKNKIDAIISYLLKSKAELPTLTFSSSIPRFGNQDINPSWMSCSFIDFILKYYPDMDKHKMLKYLCTIYFVNHGFTTHFITHFTEKTGQQIDSEIFQYIVASQDFRCVEIILDSGYFPTRSDMIFAKRNRSSIAHKITEYYAQKTLKRKRTDTK